MAKTVCLDPGHSGSDPGAVDNGLLEKNLTLSIVQKVSAKLNNRDVKQIFTRTGDNTVSLGDRCAIANNAGADYFLSIHINAGGGTGFESYVYNGQHGSGTDNARAVIHKRVAPAFANFGLPDRGMKSANFQVLRETNMSACLLELGFIDHPKDAGLLKSDAFLDALAQAIADGLAEALALPLLAPIAPPAPIVDEEKEQLKAKVTALEVYKAVAEKDTAALTETIALLQAELSAKAFNLAKWEDLGDKLKELLGV